MLQRTIMMGLGRPAEDVIKFGQTSTHEDIVTYHNYDEQGREQFKYAPISFVNTPGHEGQLCTLPYAQISSFYAQLYPGQPPYNQTTYDNSPIGKMTGTLAPGTPWVGSARGIQYQYGSNQSSDNIPIWKINTMTNNPYFYLFYPDNQLSLIITTDEDGKTKYEYRDKVGNIVCVRNYTDAQSYAETDYIYDDLNHLRWVLSPEAVNQSSATYNPPTTYWTISQDILDGLCFYYQYDQRGRKIIAKLPGKAADYTIYDQRNRAVLTQDGNLRNDGKWAYTVYDAQDRPSFTGLTTASNTYYGWSSLFNNPPSYQAYGVSSILYYLLKPDLHNSFPNSLTDADIYVQYYYDDYNNSDIAFYSQYVNNNSDLTGSGPACPPQPTSASKLTKGLLTGTKVKIMDGASPANYLTKANLYDDKGRVIQINSNCPFSQNNSFGIDVTTNRYDFQGTLISQIFDNTNTVCHDPAFQHTQIVKSYVKDYYSNTVRSLNQNINGAGSRVIYSNIYDFQNRIKSKSHSINADNYTYNVRGWLTGINAATPSVFDASSNPNFFSEMLCYDHGFQSKLYDGNIAGIIWRGYLNAPKKSYGYTYDGINRLNHAEFRKAAPGSQNWDHMDEDYTASNISYDNNGNILTMNQRGPTSMQDNTPLDMDLLSYQYKQNTNILINVTDGGQSMGAMPITPDFKDGNVQQFTNHSDHASPTTDDYNYDDNGNLIRDRNKGIFTPTVYSYLNKPTQIQIDPTPAQPNGGMINYTYDALGDKIKKTVTTTNSVVNTWYDGPLVFSDDQSQAIGNNNNNGPYLQYILHEEGRCRPMTDPANNNSVRTNSANNLAVYQYDYFEKDHLGNVRSVWNAEAVGLWAMTSSTSTSAAAAFMVATNSNTGMNDPVDYNTSLEVAQAATDALVWSHLDDVRADKPGSTSSTDTKAAELIGTDTAKRVAAAVMLKVMPGDKFSVTADSYYDALDSNDVTSGDNVLGSLLGALTGGTGYGGHQVEGQNLDVLNSTLGNPELPSTYDDMLNQTYDSTAPNAYLNYLVFDNNFQLVSSNSGMVQAGATANQWNTIGTNGNVEIQQPGYLVVFTSSRASKKLYMDKVNLTFYQGALLEENHYYPFGLTLTTSQSTPPVNNNSNKFQNQRLEDDLGLNVYDYKYREHDMQIGRFWQVDPLSEKYPYNSTYAFSENKVTNSIELEGLEAVNLSNGETAYGPYSNSYINEFNDRYREGDASNFSSFQQSYSPPQIDFLGSGFGGSLRANFEVSNAPISGLQAIQTLSHTPLEQAGLNLVQRTATERGLSNPLDGSTGFLSGTFRFQTGGSNYEGFVDGGINSLYAKLGRSPAGGSLPYYIAAYEHATQWNRTSGVGSISINDRPNFQDLSQSTLFSTYIIGQNYLGSGKDRILGGFDWSYSNGNLQNSGGINGVNFVPTNSMSPLNMAILQHDYPSYHFYGNKSGYPFLGQ